MLFLLPMITPSGLDGSGWSTVETLFGLALVAGCAGGDFGVAVGSATLAADEVEVGVDVDDATAGVDDEVCSSAGQFPALL